jgi:quercetin dioxygenase-like cupin family protein
MVFPDEITRLPQAELPFAGATAYLSQAETHQVLFMEFTADVNLPEHAHAAQVGFVLAGRIDLTIEGERCSYTQGDHYSIPAGVAHSAHIYAGYADITYFADSQRYRAKRSMP